MSNMSRFRPFQDEFLKTNSKAAWDEMFRQVIKNCKIQMGLICEENGLRISEEDFKDYYLNAAVFIMGRYKKELFIKKGGYEIKSIDKVCRNAIRQVFQNPKETARSKLKRAIADNNNSFCEVTQNEYF